MHPDRDIIDGGWGVFPLSCLIAIVRVVLQRLHGQGAPAIQPQGLAGDEIGIAQ